MIFFFFFERQGGQKLGHTAHPTANNSKLDTYLFLQVLFNHPATVSLQLFLHSMPVSGSSFSCLHLFSLPYPLQPSSPLQSNNPIWLPTVLSCGTEGHGKWIIYLKHSFPSHFKYIFPNKNSSLLKVLGAMLIFSEMYLRR